MTIDATARRWLMYGIRGRGSPAARFRVCWAWAEAAKVTARPSASGLIMIRSPFNARTIGGPSAAFWVAPDRNSGNHAGTTSCVAVVAGLATFVLLACR